MIANNHIPPTATPTKERRRSRTNSRVHFPEDVHDSQIQASHEYNAMIDVNLGFLQTHHIYEVQFTVRDSVTGPVTASIDRQVIVKSIEAFPTQDGKCFFFLFWMFQVHYDTRQEYISNLSQLSVSNSFLQSIDSQKRCKVGVFLLFFECLLQKMFSTHMTLTNISENLIWLEYKTFQRCGHIVQ